MSNKNICHLLWEFDPYYSGRANYLKRVMRFLSANGYRSVVIAARYSKNIPACSIINEITVYRILVKRYSHDFVKVIKLVIFLVRNRKKYSILHLHGYYDIWGVITLSCKMMKKKVIFHATLFGSDDPLTIARNNRFMFFRYRFFPQFDAFISHSTPISEAYRNTPLDVDKLFYIPNGVDCGTFLPVDYNRKSGLRDEYGFYKNDKIACFVGAVIKRKGVDILCEAWNILKRMDKDYKLILVGPYEFNDNESNQYVSEIRKYINKNKLNIKFFGRVINVFQLLQLSDLFVFPSRLEGFGNVIIEAMACGLPVVISSMNGIANDIITDGVEGYITDGTPKDIADKVNFLFSNPDKLNTMGVNAVSSVRRKFDINVVVKKYIDVYEGL